MSIDFNRIDEFILKQIVKKLSISAASNFYRSCRAARDLVDTVKPLWPIPETMLSYSSRRLFNTRGGIEDHVLIFVKSRTFYGRVPLEFCGIAEVEVLSCEANFFEQVVLPQLALMGRVEKLHIGCMRSECALQRLIAAAKPDTVKVCDRHFDIFSATFEKINLHIIITPATAHNYWKTMTIFELGKDRRHITLATNFYYEEILTTFLENWYKGQSTGSLEKLTLFQWWDHMTSFARDNIQKNVENLLKSFISTPGGYILEREGLEGIRICANFERRYIEIELVFM